MSKYDESRVRHGKTRRDHESGSHAQRLKNNDERAAWHRKNPGEQSRGFPFHTCNGRKSRALRGEK